MTTTTLPASLQAAINLMDNAAEELQRITERTEFALSVVTQAIRTQEAIAKGKVLKQLRDEIPDGEWLKFLNREDVRLTNTTALMYMNAATAVEDAAPLYGEEMLLNFPSNALARIHTLPADAKLEVLDQAEASGKPPTTREVAAVAQKTETKLSKTAEQLAEAKRRKEEKKANGKETWDDEQSIKKYEARILQLESELEREKEQKQELADSKGTAEDELHTATKKLEEAQAELAKALEESHKLRFDGDTARAQRVSRVGNQLILTIPGLLADLQKYVAEKEHFSENVQVAVGDQLKTLMSYMDEHFKHNEAEEEPSSSSGR